MKSLKNYLLLAALTEQLVTKKNTLKTLSKYGIERCWQWPSLIFNLSLSLTFPRIIRSKGLCEK